MQRRKVGKLALVPVEPLYSWSWPPNLASLFVLYHKFPSEVNLNGKSGSAWAPSFWVKPLCYPTRLTASKKDIKNYKKGKCVIDGEMKQAPGCGRVRQPTAPEPCISNQDTN